MVLIWITTVLAGVGETYAQMCAACHGIERYGGTAPPLLPEALKRKKDAQLVSVILEGRGNTQMPAFKDQLSEAQAQQLVAMARTPVEDIQWDLERIRMSRQVSKPDGPPLPEMNHRDLTLVVERGSASISVLDGDLKEVDRFPVLGQVHGGPKFDQTLSRVWAITRDGMLTTYDLKAGGVTATAQVAVNARNVAVAPDGRHVAVASQLPSQLVLLNGALEPQRVVPLQGQPSGVYHLPGTPQFMVTLRDVAQMLLVDPDSGVVTQKDLDEPFEDFAFVPGTNKLLASARQGQRIMLFDLEKHTIEASLDTKALPHLFSACFFEREGILYAALNHIGLPKLTIVRVEDLRVEAEIPLAGSGYFARTHPGTPYIWVDSNTEQVQLIHKQTLALHELSLVPAKGKKAMHVEFSADGKTAMVSVWHDDGAVVVYDATTLQEQKRIPFSMPIGKYNAYNKTAQWR